MKISNKEKVMLYILGIIVVCFVYYQFIYSYQIKVIEEKTKQESELERKYTTVTSTIKSLEDRKSDAKVLKTKVGEESAPFYPIISQEHIILELNTLMSDSGLKGGIKFNPIVSDSVEAVNKNNKVLAESSIQGIVDEYNGIDGDKDVKSSENKQATANTTNNNVKDGAANNNSNTENSKASVTDGKDKKKNTVQYVKIDVNFDGTYEELNKFLTAIDNREKKIVVNSIKINADTLQNIKGTISLEIYSVPKISDELQDYLKWDLNNTYGKSMPFDAATGVDVGQVATNTGKQVKGKTSSGDFIASVKSITSDLPKLIIGKSDDELKTSYIYGDSNTEEPIEMVLTQDGDKYYYKYKTSKESFPTNYDGIGEEFIPSGSDIGLSILSEARANSSDNSSIRIKIINKTDKTIDVNIFGDDSSNPRVKVDGNENNVKVINH